MSVTKSTSENESSNPERKSDSSARVTKQSAAKAAAKTAKSPEGERQAGTRQTAQAAAKKVAKTVAQ